MRFRVVPRGGRAHINGQDTCYLITDNWDDYNFRTLHFLIYLDNAGNRHEIGLVKIESLA